MADSTDNDKRPDHQLGSFDEDLDAMLQETDSDPVSDNDEILDDEDAIDRLLMKESLDTEDDEFASLEQADINLNAKVTTNERELDVTDEAIDEFADLIDTVTNEENDKTPAMEPVSVTTVESEQDPLINDVFEEIDEFGEIFESSGTVAEAQAENLQEVTQKPPITPLNEALKENTSDISEEAIFSDDFDISTEDSDALSDPTNTLTNLAEQEGAITGISQEAALNSDEIDSELELITHTVAESGQSEEVLPDSAVNAQISQLQAEIQDLKQGGNSNTDDTEKNTKELRKIKKQLADYNKIKTFSYVAIATAFFALIFAGTLAVLSFGMQTDIDNLSESVTDQDETLTDLNVNGLNREVVINSKAINTLKQALSEMDEQLTLKIAAEIKKSDVNTERSELTELSGQLSETNAKIAALSHKVSILEKNKNRRSKKAALKTRTIEWTVNLVSFKQEWFAKKKANEFKKQGIPVEVLPVKVHSEQWYRLRVIGFKSKYEAGSYASRVKKALNLSSVWVTRK